MQINESRCLVTRILASLLAVLFPLQALPQSMNKPDALVEAAIYETRAREMQPCNPEEAERWCRKALETARRFRSADQAERDMAGAFIGRTEMLLSQIRLRRELAREVGQALNKLMEDDKLQSAQRMLLQNSDLVCRQEIRSAQSTVQTRQQEVRTLIDHGDRMIQVNPSRAIKLYQQAQKIDREHPLTAEKIHEAKQLKKAHGGSSIGKVIGISLLLAAAGGAAYYGYERQKQLQAKRR